MPKPLVLVMGVSGAGKSTVGALLAARLDAPFADADAFHPPANIAKMSRGEPLGWMTTAGPGWTRSAPGWMPRRRTAPAAW
jgi:carbohydrate kinase (thermoresistant glucokinase family)